MNNTFRVARIAGVDVSVHITWVIAVFLVTWTLGAGYYPDKYQGWDSWLYPFAGVLSALLLFACVLLHEMAHSLVAMAMGLPVHGITLFIFGGISAIDMEADEAHNEFIVAVVGPLTSLLLAGACYMGSAVAPDGTMADAIVKYLTTINVGLALFNLVPGFPLDGGRVLRSVVWGVTGDFEKASRWAAWAGQFVGFFLVASGVVWLFWGHSYSGLWMMLIGWFLSNAAEASKVTAVTDEVFSGLLVADLLEASPVVLPPDTPVGVFVREYILRRGYRALPVVLGDRVLGIVSLTDVKKVAEAQWATTPVTAIMTRERLVSVTSNDDAATALRLLAEHQIHQVLVVDDGQLKGVVTRTHLVEYFQLREELGVRTSRSGAREAPAG